MTIPVSTYRLQLTPDLGFEAARERLGYLDRLGIGALYLSPVFEARTGSIHGYDVTDPTRIRAELGGEEAFRRLAEAARERDMGVVVDFVPNHMAADWENPWWRDLLAHGRESDHAAFFDVDWERPAGPARGKVVLPVLGKPWAEVLADGEIAIERADGETLARYFERRFPLDPATLPERAGALPGPSDPDRLDALLGRQNWWLVPWRKAGEAANYRRFFTIADLVGVRVEEPAVFDAVHRRLAELIRERLVTGVRIDHVDGLFDPAGYLERLRGLDPAGELWVVVEKILAREERLPETWPVAGTTGYDFLGVIEGLLVEGEGLERIEAAYGAAIGEEPAWEEVAHETKRAIAEEGFAGDLGALARDLLPFARDDPRGRDLTPAALREALLEVTACLPVYRTYVDGEGLSAHDRRVLEAAFAGARDRCPNLPAAAFDVLGELLALEVGVAALPVVRRWQQLSGAIMAKGVEDTAFYRHNPLISLNEVGTDPGEGALDPAGFHAWYADRARRWPHAMNASSTHDTKRSEDIRARIAALSWIPDRWTERLAAWREWNARLVERVDGEPAPDPAREISLYQTLLGAWPLDPAGEEAFLERLAGYLPKALREAKLHSDWAEPATAYERAVVGFAGRILDPGRDAPFRWDFLGFQREVAGLGARLSIAGLVLKLCAPGVPDLYQGCEAACLSLVDPDNRRPIDWLRREALLEETGREEPVPAAASDPTAYDPTKLAITRVGLALRRERTALFRDGAYLPLEVDAGESAAVVAFARRTEREWLVAIAARDPATGPWGEAALRLPEAAPRGWRPVVGSGPGALEAPAGRLPLERALGGSPAAILVPA